MVCHCVDCQVFSSSPYRVVVFCKGQDFKFKGKGRAKEYIKTTAESGNKRIQAFCGECGSQLYGCDLDRIGYNVLASDVWISVTVSVLSNIYLEHLHKMGT